MMKILINPDWADLLEPLPPEEVKEITLCMLQHPHREYDHPIWRYIQKELRRNQQKYDAKISCLDKNRQKRWQSEHTATDSEQMSVQPVQALNPSGVIDRKEKLDINNINKKKEIDLLLRKTIRNFSPDAPQKYLIDDNFSFKQLAADDLEFQIFYMNCSDPKLIQAEQSLRHKHYDEHFTVKQIIGWINQEGRF